MILRMAARRGDANMCEYLRWGRWILKLRSNRGETPLHVSPGTDTQRLRADCYAQAYRKCKSSGRGRKFRHWPRKKACTHCAGENFIGGGGRDYLSGAKSLCMRV